jgi:hypothetical protein
LGYSYGAAGREEDALKGIRKLEQLSQPRHVSPFWTGVIDVALPRKDTPFSGWNEPASNARRG